MKVNDAFLTIAEKVKKLDRVDSRKNTCKV